ncbi:MAG: type II toxin-antitoxin system VapC family toxin [Coriobacteriia bacterium]|nr:type II toxin-antitoxin system VapC family toxin [Coriobacteriia bacterium]
MSRPIVIDSSVAVKWFEEPTESGAAEAFSLLDAHRDGDVLLAAPTHLILEVLNALRLSPISADELAQVALELERFAIAWVDITTGLASNAARVARKHGLTVYDATFVATALMLDAELITDDKAILRSGACRMRALTG